MTAPSTSPRRAALIALLALSTSHCGASSPLIVGPMSDPGAGPFAGDWTLTGTGTQSIDTDGGPSVPPSSTNIQMRLAIADATGVSMTVTITGIDGSGGTCPLPAVRRGSTATIVANSSCVVGSGSSAATMVFRQGSLSLAGTTLTFTATLNANIPAVGALRLDFTASGSRR